MKKIDIDKIEQWYDKNKEQSLEGRWIPFSKIEPLFEKMKVPFKVSKIGHSVNNIPINKVEIGNGDIQILMWSQMHGNESTGTKALFDLFSFFKNPEEFKDLSDQILNNCTITFIPMLNPDGALAYTRINAKNVDLNRDAVDLKSPESKLLNSVLKEVNPQYCFNLHDQRTIFTVGDTKKPATLSFLAPSVDESREITEGRKQTMSVIVAINELMQKIIPGQVGRYTDEFYPTATGDNFQKAGHNTILVEAGHFKDDYKREVSRKLNFISILKGLIFIADKQRNEVYKPYFDIPNNTKFYLDIIYRNIFLEEENKMVDVGVLFKEVLKDNQILFIPQIEQVEDLKNYNANLIVNKKGEIIKNETELNLFVKK